MNTGGAGDGGLSDSPIAVLSAAAGESRAAENTAAAARLKAVHELFQQCVREERPDPDARPGYAHLDPFDVCVTHLVALFALSVARAETMIVMARDLVERCPDILRALADGRIDLTTVERFLKQLRNVDPAVIGRVQREAIEAYLAALGSGTVLGAGAIRSMIDEVIGRHDPDGVREREKDAKANRGVQVFKDGDGMSSVLATLTSEESAVLTEALDVRAEQLVAAAGPVDAGAGGPSRGELRADALMSLVLGDPVPGATAPGASASSDRAPVLRPQITVIAYPGGAPGVQYPRSGESSIEALLDLLGCCDGASILTHDPTLGAHDDPAREHVYRPSASLARAIKLRDGTCRHPGCSVPAEQCDVDHVIPFDHDDPARGGSTAEWNHLTECRRHHRFKTFSGWDYSMRPDGALIITTPDGKTITTLPSGPLADFRRAAEADDAEAADGVVTQNGVAATDGVAAPDGAVIADDPGVPALPDDPDAVPTFFARRVARIRAERRRVSECGAQTDRERRRRAAARRGARRPGAGSYLKRHPGGRTADGFGRDGLGPDNLRPDGSAGSRAPAPATDDEPPF